MLGPVHDQTPTANVTMLITTDRVRGSKGNGGKAWVQTFLSTVGSQKAARSPNIATVTGFDR